MLLLQWPQILETEELDSLQVMAENLQAKIVGRIGTDAVEV
jgi:hypothetical protein